MVACRRIQRVDSGQVASEPAMKLPRPVTAILVALLAMTLAAPAAAAATRPPAKAKPVVHLASLEWEPYIGPKMPTPGYVAALIRAAYAEQGMAVEIAFSPWARALHLARTGAVDGLMPEYFNPSRESEFEYSAGF